MGKHIVIATARPPRSAAELLPGELLGSALICYNGAEIYEGGERIYRKSLQPAAMQQIVGWLRQNHPDCKVCIEADDALYANQAFWEGWECKLVDLEDVIIKPAAKILVDLGYFTDRSIFMEVLPEECTMATTDGGCLGHIMAAAVSKASALEFLLEGWGLSMDNVIAFGDDDNDMEIISRSSIGVAMGNAIPELKKAADIITASNDEDGIALILDAVL
jgi:Cof subfamily protein (haloacid dehalogenase superfamily)